MIHNFVFICELYYITTLTENTCRPISVLCCTDDIDDALDALESLPIDDDALDDLESLPVDDDALDDLESLPIDSVYKMMSDLNVDSDELIEQVVGLRGVVLKKVRRLLRCVSTE